MDSSSEYVAVYSYMTRNRIAAQKATREAVNYVFNGTVLESTVELVPREELTPQGVHVHRGKSMFKRRA